MGKLLEELKRRKVFRVAAVYAVVAWVLIQVSDVVLPTFGAPEWVNQTIIFLFILGFLPTLIAAWAYEITPEGVRADAGNQATQATTSNSTDRKLIYTILGLVLLVVGFQVADRFVFESQANPAASADLGPERPLNSVRLPLRLENSYTTTSAQSYSHAISTNGEQIAFIGYDDYESQLYFHSPDTDSPRRIENSNGANSPFFSPDGESIAFSAQGKLKRVSVSGGNPVDIISINGSFRGGSWGGDNKIVYSQQLYVVKPSWTKLALI